LQNDLVKISSTGEKSTCTLSEVVDQLDTQIAENSISTETSGIKTGMKKFDNYSGGLQKSDLVIIAAESSQGKTALGLSILKYAAQSQEIESVVFSMEMSRLQLTARILAQEVQISSNRILNAPLAADEIKKIRAVKAEIAGLPIYFDERSSTNIDEICNSIISLKLKHDIQLVMIDYLQLVGSSQKDRSEESQIADIARKLKNLAKKLDITIIALSQLSRDRTNPRPQKNRLRGSGQIEEAADIVLLLWRPSVYGISKFDEYWEGISTAGKAEISIAKGRNIGVGNFLVGFDEATTRFYDL